MGNDFLERPLTNRFREALACAFELHRKQPRKGTQIPYVAHLLSVAALALEHSATEDEAIAALLPDAVEDQGGPPTAAAIRQRFGDAVADIVEACRLDLQSLRDVADALAASRHQPDHLGLELCRELPPLPSFE